MKVSVRRMKSDQIDVAEELDRRCFGDEDAPYKRFESGITVLVFSNQYIIGFGHLSGQREIDRIGVLPAYRRKGIGQKILAAIIRYAKRFRYPILTSYAARWNNGSHLMFLKVGFQPRCMGKWIHWTKTLEGK